MIVGSVVSVLVGRIPNSRVAYFFCVWVPYFVIAPEVALYDGLLRKPNLNPAAYKIVACYGVASSVVDSDGRVNERVVCDCISFAPDYVEAA